MTIRTTRQRSHLLVVDPNELLPAELHDAIHSASHWSVVNSQSRRAPTVAILVTHGETQPSALITQFFTTVASIPTVVYDATPNTTRQASAFTAGANGYIVPGVTLAELIPVVQLAQLGGFSTCPSAHKMLREQLRAPVEFSRREQEVVTRYALGASLQDVAEDLQLGLQSVEEALQRACRKAAVDSPVALVTWWTRWVMSEELPVDLEDGVEPSRYVMTA